jgi:hypothetical protein
MLNSLQFSTEDYSHNPPKQPISKPESLSQQHESPNPGSQKRNRFAKGDVVPQSVSSKKREKPSFTKCPTTGPVSTGCSYQELFYTPKDTQFGNRINIDLQQSNSSTA